MDGITNSMDMSLSKLWELVMDKGGLVCCSPLSFKESNTTQQLNGTELTLGVLQSTEFQRVEYDSATKRN